MGIRDWVEARWREFGHREQVLFMVGCWALWEHCNKVVFDAREVNPASIIKRVLDVVEEIEGGGFLWLGRGGEGVQGGREAGKRGWVAPPVGFVKINVDAGVKEGEGVSVGVVSRNDRGKVLWGLSVVQDVTWEAHIAEASAVFEGLNEAARRGHTKIVVESDCLTVIDALKRKAKGKSMFSLLLEDISNLCNSFESVLWSHTCRVNNMIAHSLAHLFPRTVGRVVWSDTLPPIANNAVIFYSRLIQ
ncbi:uncharacterized protein LOC141608159 [Silene latifolia]|uniref:uncharacterized protein LOC141608159 n=1 Tax=Silene latifolia TaxID=37657 RepID=UPI003D781C0B